MRYTLKKFFIFIGAIFLIGLVVSGLNGYKTYTENKQFKIISSTSNTFFDGELKNYAKEKGINLTIDYYGDLEIIDILNSKSFGLENAYDAVWISNSIWLYMLENQYLVTDSKSIATNPVVMALKKSKARELGFDSGEITNKMLLDAIREKKLNYVMPSVTKTNIGASAYLGFLNSLAGSPEVLSLEMLESPTLLTDLRTFFSGVERVSGDELYLKDMFYKGSYDAIINYESSLIEMNKHLVQEGKEELYLVYPVDGVSINDMPFGYIDRGQEKKKTFEEFLSFLRSDETKLKMESLGLRTWYGGTNTRADKSSFNPSWGIDTNKYLISLKYPSKKVITEALNIYIEQLRKPNHTVFCLDVSGSMTGNGIRELKESMNYILDRAQASVDRLQFSPSDKISIITFNGSISDKTRVYNGDNTEELISFVSRLQPSGNTNIYSPVQRALETLAVTSEDYTKTVILMTDGYSNGGSFESLESYYKNAKLDIPVYSIMFGESSAEQLSQIATLTNAKVFDGKVGLKEAFMEVRSYN